MMRGSEVGMALRDDCAWSDQCRPRRSIGTWGWRLRVALRDEDKMERRQQSGDGGTWQAPAIPATAEFEGRRAVVATERVAAETADTDVTESMSALTATVGKGNDRRVVIDTHAVLEALGVRKGGVMGLLSPIL
ncbi:hypothetical protein PF005_g29597 [Phytophthora fragariae]|uniref:Uncharacterized protein n=1 Tax=Phytophthora fragariae TaxID=53985 RepID=A0A6A3H4S7_9STRA|nr:hypothetical protein PF003_g26071 [Phytophthora fragariae]KAE8919440.1 hypothetical protein PF009_g30256 [Phytophthora fragariae]KAE8964072.1 hypothetical protein PF011_g28803 [Phytophthora fragariae]KAE9069216.1 hypothetical protein PF006_g29627 [Phytophthora fragariae]KAE9087546.1 hypothetical protein PF007_g20332 [Phytophthora fragariae]